MEQVIKTSHFQLTISIEIEYDVVFHGKMSREVSDMNTSFTNNSYICQNGFILIPRT